MADKKVPRTQTYITESQLTQAFTQAWRKLFSTIPTKKQIAILLAQNALETNHSKNMYNFNIGNITHSTGDGFDYFQFDKPLMEQVSKGNWKAQEMHFRAYPSLEEGVEDYLNNLKKRGKGSVWKEISKEDPAAFSKALKNSGYYTDNEEDTVDPITGKVQRGYTSNVVSLTDHFAKSKDLNNPNHEFAESAANPTVADTSNASTISQLLDAWKNLMG
jgi:hypothetical protein